MGAETRAEAALNEIRSKTAEQDARLAAQDERFARMETAIAAMSVAMERMSQGSGNRRQDDDAESSRGRRMTGDRQTPPRGPAVHRNDIPRDEIPVQPPPRRDMNDLRDQVHLPTRLTKMDFPKFTGEDVDQWIYSTEMFFQIDRTEERLKVDYACAHLSGDARKWFSAYLQHRLPGRAMTWLELKDLVLREFGPSEFDDPVDEWKDLKQTASVKEFGRKYLDVLYKLPELSEGYAIKGYLNGLKGEIANAVRIQKPSSLNEAMGMAKLQERANKDLQEAVCDNLIKRGYLANKGGPILPTPRTGQWQTRFFKEQGATGSKEGFTTVPKRKLLDQKTYEEKRKNNLCFSCDEKWQPGHKCKTGATVMSIELVLETEEDAVQWEEKENEDPNGDTLLAINGGKHFETMKVQGLIDNQRVWVLIDSGSTHNFVHPRIVKGPEWKKEATGKLIVTVADGNQLSSVACCSGGKLQLQDFEFGFEARLLAIPKFDIILGVQWLQTLGEIHWNFQTLVMRFQYQGQQQVLQGSASTEVCMMEGKELQSVMKKGINTALLCVRMDKLGQQDSQVFSITASGIDSQYQEQIQKLVEEYQDIFAEPKALPPQRQFDHSINLKEGTKEVHLRPYRYPTMQKNELEKMVEELLSSGLIRQSQSPFSSPVVLVKKKDASWRLCVDYRRLNEITIKDKFPIPLIEELMDELFGSKIFSKLDLRAGYHQVRMKEEDVFKTAFKTHEGHYEFVVMPFGLTNAPSTFQRLMNSVFKPYLRKFVLVFFDDILVYSNNWTDHLMHLRLVFEILRQQQLFLKFSKCSLGCLSIDYLGHVISQQGVSVDMSKIEDIKNWPIPTSLKKLRGFLGLTGYYRRFIKNYGSIAQPLTKLLKVGNFQWTIEAAAAFESLKKAMMQPPVLALPNFEDDFIIETDASQTGMGAVLQQKGHPIAFLSKGLGPKLQLLPAYEREMLAVIHAIKKWRGYLQFRPFVIKTDHEALKHILEQKIRHPSQEKWLYKLLGFDFTVQYKRGKENIVADALSRVEDTASCFVLSEFASVLMKKIAASWLLDPNLQQTIQKLEADASCLQGYSLIQGILRKEGRIIVGPDSELRHYIISTMHNSAVGGHSGSMVTYQKLRQAYYWRGLERDVREFVRNCIECQRQKWETQGPKGLLQPLNIPTTIWTDISMDFIEGLPKSKGFTVILVVVDRLSKMAHFISLAHPFTAGVVARHFMDYVFKLHGMPLTIVSDRDKIFLSSFWKELCRLQGIAQCLSTAYHPQSDGQTEVVNRSLETYLRCMAGQKPTTWSTWLPLAEWWYNTNFHSATLTTPYEAVYGQPPPIHSPYLAGDSRVEAVDRSLATREDTIRLLRFHLQRAQNRMQQQANKKRIDCHYEVDDWVFVKLQPYRQSSLKGKTHKLSPRYYGPFRIVARVGKVAYRLDIPVTARMHNVLHISQLKRKVGNLEAIPHSPDLRVEEERVPIAVLDDRVVRRNGLLVGQFLIRWNNVPDEDATWEDENTLDSAFPSFLSSWDIETPSSNLVRGRTRLDGEANDTC